MKWVNKGELAVGRRREDAAAGGYMRRDVVRFSNQGVLAVM